MVVCSGEAITNGEPVPIESPPQEFAYHLIIPSGEPSAYSLTTPGSS